MVPDVENYFASLVYKSSYWNIDKYITWHMNYVTWVFCVYIVASTVLPYGMCLIKQQACVINWEGKKLHPEPNSIQLWGQRVQFYLKTLHWQNKSYGRL